MSQRPLPVVVTWRWWGGFALVAAGAAWLTILAYREGLPEIFAALPHLDKVVHFTVAGLLAAFLDRALRRRNAFTVASVPMPVAALVVLVPAGIEEYLQGFSAHRTSSIWDFAADLLGVVLLVALSRRLAQ